MFIQHKEVKHRVMKIIPIGVNRVIGKVGCEFGPDFCTIFLPVRNSVIKSMSRLPKGTSPLVHPSSNCNDANDRLPLRQFTEQDCF